jgi:hypothetical protein
MVIQQRYVLFVLTRARQERDEVSYHKIIMSNEEKTKPFQFRNIPESIHFSWKVVALFDGQTMEEFGLEAINKHVKERQSARKTELQEAALAMGEDTGSE